MRRNAFLPLLIALLSISLYTALPLLAQKPPQEAPAQPALKSLRELTLESIYDPKSRVAFSGAPQSGFVWLDDRTFTWPRTNEKGEVQEQAVMDVDSPAPRRLFEAAKLETALRGAAGMSAAEAARAAHGRSWNLSPDHKTLLLTAADDLFLYDLVSGALTRLTSTPGQEQEATFSPDGKRVAFLRGNNLYAVDVDSQRERQLTVDGSEEVLNGMLDWVYQEEIFGRGNFHAYWWSPDSSRIAFLQIDERPVKRYTVVDHIPYHPELDVSDYPLAGDPNPAVSLKVVKAAGGELRTVDTSAYAAGDIVIVGVSWSPDSSRVLYQLQDREQTWLDLDTFSVGDGAASTLFRETTKAWVDNNGDPVWLPDGSFLWASERSGFRHLYHYAGDGKLLAPVTSGRWEVRTIYGADKGGQWLYFSGTERSPIAEDIYRIRIDGSGLQRLSQGRGTHAASFNPSRSRYLDSWSSLETPPTVTLLGNDGKQLRVVAANEPLLLGQFRLSKPELVQVKTRDGFVMEAMLIKPPDFDPSKKYPVYEHTYSGPHSQQVVDRWGGPTYLFHQYLASRGIVVWICDNRSASGKGAESAWPIYRNFGELELRDLEDGLRWLTAQPGIDGKRVLINGWSFGGYMTSYALTHSTLWSAGISGGTVTDWRDYDTVYTERYMQRPQNNPEGYKKSSPRFAAANLHGELLLLHGTTDDNVHLQNAIQFIYELQRAQKPFELMLYPKSRHGVTDPALALHMRTTMLRFIEKELLAR
jgi:dipeptidyl-peptidase-4